MELQISVSKRGVQIEHQRFNCYKQINKTITTAPKLANPRFPNLLQMFFVTN